MLTGKTVVVTGGSRGLGRAMVHGFAAQGASVVIASRKFEGCKELAGQIEDRYAVRALPVACNVSNWDECTALIDETLGEFGSIDVLVNNAGLSPLYPGLDQVSEALFDKVIAVNLRAPFRLAALAGKHMMQQGGGAIINIGSIEAIRPGPDALPYAAAKAGLHTLTEGFAQALGPTVRVNTIQCGPFLTDISTNWTPGVRARLEGSLALARCGQPEEVVAAALFFATDASSFCTGAVLRVDGGMP